MERLSRRIDGKVVKGYVVDDCFYRTKKEAGLARSARKEHYTVPNTLYLLIGYAAVDDAELMQELQYAFDNFAGTPHRNGMPSISVNKLVQLAHTQEVIYSTNHPDSPNHAAYDAAMTVLVCVLRDRLNDWKEDCGWSMQAQSGSIAELMQSLGYDISNSSGTVSNTVNVSIVNGKMLTGAEANAAWLKQQGLSPVKR